MGRQVVDDFVAIAVRAAQCLEYAHLLSLIHIYAYTTYTLTDTVDPAFVLDESSIRASAGKVSLSTDENGNPVLIWTLSGVPFTEHTLSFQEKLKADERGIHPTGELDLSLIHI